MYPLVRYLAVCLPMMVVVFGSLGMAQETKAKKEEAHPATSVAKLYLSHIGERRWQDSVKLIDPLFLKDVHGEYVRQVMRTVSIDDEVALLQAVGAERLRDLQAMRPADFYVIRRKSNDAATLTPETQKQMSKTSEVEILGAIAESEELVHVLARHRQETLKEKLSEMIVISLEKTSGGRWMVSPKHQKMRVTPLIDPSPTTSPK